eukprot:scaffold17.g444.t1
MVRAALKEPLKSKAKVREVIYYRSAQWKDGVPQKQAREGPSTVRTRSQERTSSRSSATAPPKRRVDGVKQQEQRVDQQDAFARRRLLWAAGRAAAALVAPFPAAATGLLQFPLTELSNDYILGYALTNPVAKTSLDAGLSAEGKRQVVRETFPALRALGLDAAAWFWPSQALGAYQTAEILAALLGVGRSRIVPEYSFLDARGVGDLERLPLGEVAAALAAGDALAPGWRPGPGTDGTPHESAADVLVRGRQLLSLLETQYSGQQVVIVSPDSDNLSILQAAVAGADLRDHRAFAFAPGEAQRLALATAPPERPPSSLPCPRPPACVAGTELGSGGVRKSRAMAKGGARQPEDSGTDARGTEQVPGLAGQPPTGAARAPAAPSPAATGALSAGPSLSFQIGAAEGGKLRLQPAGSKAALLEEGAQLDSAALEFKLATDEATAKAAVEAAAEVEHAGGEPPEPRFSWKAFCFFVGPGLLMSVAYLDPGNLQADVSAGAQTGFSLLWWFALVSLVCETVGCAQALYILSQGTVPLWAGCLIVSASAFGLLLLERKGARWLEALFGGAIAVLAISMAVNFFRADVPAGPFFKGLFVPTLSRESIIPAVGALGALVMPYNLFFHSSVINHRQHDTSRNGRIRVLLKYLRLENMLALLLAFFINMCVVAVFATGFYDDPDVDPNEIGLQAAGELLSVRFGATFEYFWAVGLLASGQIATIALTYAGQLIMQGLLRLRLSGGWRYAATRLVALVPALTVALTTTSSNKFDQLNQQLNVVQSIQLPFALLPSAAAYACWPLFIAAYYCALAYYAVGPERAGRWAAAAGRRAAAAGRLAATAAKGVRWRDAESVVEVHF